MMQRDIGEIIDSQKKMLNRLQRKEEILTIQRMGEILTAQKLYAEKVPEAP